MVLLYLLTVEGSSDEYDKNEQNKNHNRNCYYDSTANLVRNCDLENLFCSTAPVGEAAFVSGGFIRPAYKQLGFIIFCVDIVGSLFLGVVYRDFIFFWYILKEFG